MKTTGKVYDFFQNHARTIGRTVLSLLLVIGAAVLCSFVPDVTFFVTFVSAVLIVIYVIKMLFVQIKNADFWWIGVFLLIMMAANRLYSFEKLVSIFPVLERINIGLALVIVTGLCVITAVIVKFYALADKQPPPEALQQVSGNTAQPPVNIGTNIDPSTSNTGTTNFMSALKGPQVKSSLVYIAIAAFLFLVIGATGFIFQMIYQDSSQKDNVNYLDVIFVYALYGLTILGIMAAILLALFILITAIRLLILAIKNIVKSDGKISDILPTYTLSALITLVLFYFVYVRNDFTLDNFTNLASSGNYLAVPLTFILLLVAFCIIMWVIHYVLILLIEVSNQKTGHNFIQRFSKDVKKIVTTIYKIVFNTINVALSFVKFIPHYFGALVRFVIGDDDDDCSLQEENTPPDETGGTPVAMSAGSTEAGETNEEG